MKDVQKLRAQMRAFEEKKISAAALGRSVFHAARQMHDPREASLRQTLERLGNRLTVLAERSLHDDVQNELRSIVDDLHAELVQLT